MSGELSHLNPPTKGDETRERILSAIATHVLEYGWPPTVRELCDAVGLTSTATVHHHLWWLVEEGRIVRDPTKPRALRIVPDPPDAA